MKANAIIEKLTNLDIEESWDDHEFFHTWNDGALALNYQESKGYEIILSVLGEGGMEKYKKFDQFMKVQFQKYLEGGDINQIWEEIKVKRDILVKDLRFEDKSNPKNDNDQRLKRKNS